MTDLDLGFNPLEPRDKDGQWVHGGGLWDALSKAKPGDTFEAPSGETYEKTWQSNKWKTGTTFAKGEDILKHKKGYLRTPEQQRRKKDKKMAKRDEAKLALRLLQNKDLATYLGEEIDLDWTNWNKGHKKGSTSLKKAGPIHSPAAGNARAKVEVKRFKQSAGLQGNNAVLGHAAMKVLKRRAQKSGHFRAKAILAASRGNVARAQKFERAHIAAAKARIAAKKAPPVHKMGAVRVRPLTAPRPKAAPKPGFHPTKPVQTFKRPKPKKF